MKPKNAMWKMRRQLWLAGWFLAVSAWAGVAGTAFAADISPRERTLMDSGWKFYLGDDWGSGENLMKAGISIGPADPNLL